MVDIRSNWEELSSNEAFSHMFRLKVPGGWLVYVDRRVAYAAVLRHYA
jgi:hypothetical protein